MNPVPMPRNPRHRRFVAARLNCMSATAAYFAAGYRCSYAAARSSASRLLQREDVAACLDDIRRKAAERHFQPAKTNQIGSIVSRLLRS